MLPDNGPERTRAEKARLLLEGKRFGVLATVSRRKPGYPFASIVNYVLDEQGRPLFLLSGLAVHTKNIAADPRASLIAFEDASETGALAAARVTATGDVRPVGAAETEAARARYIDRLPDAAQYFEFGDFSLYRMEIAEAYYVGGFGEMGWISAQDYSFGLIR